MMTQPHRMDIEIRHNNSLLASQPPLSLEPGNNFGRQKMSADYDFGLVLLEQPDKGARIQLVKRQPLALVFPGFVKPIIKPPKQIRSLSNHVDVNLGIDMAK